MSILLLIGLVQSEMDEKGYVFVKGKGWIPKTEAESKPKFIDYTPEPRLKRERKYKK